MHHSPLRHAPNTNSNDEPAHQNPHNNKKPLDQNHQENVRGSYQNDQNLYGHAYAHVSPGGGELVKDDHYQQNAPNSRFNNHQSDNLARENALRNKGKGPVTSQKQNSNNNNYNKDNGDRNSNNAPVHDQARGKRGKPAAQPQPNAAQNADVRGVAGRRVRQNV